ncbi:hypothetical protein [uncultured Bifidobacterium sp.]|uniref:hypothetical protein n=1 Tax=uncultured Bifidobacterium sp. TaxID=165187 RepID=UPI002583D28E|nr:hypothetical protein [uncultured Bifidobacterium sp.]
METVFKDGNLIIRPTEPDDPGGVVMSMDALAAWSQLLGTSSMAETVNAVLKSQDPGLIDRQTGENAWTGAYDGLQAALNDTASTVSMVAADGETVLNDPLTAAHNRTRTLLGLAETSEADDTLQLSVDDSRSGQADAYQGVDLSDVDTVMQQDEAASAYDMAVEGFYESLQPKTTQQ